jgi:Rrf2 family nitric oxide-sensitive transcriptional repressor
MRLSLQTDYSLRTLMFLASNPGRRHVAEIATFYGISEAHVAKVVHHLSRMGYIRSQRGVGGGVELARSPDDITIGDVVTAVEGDVHLLQCLGMQNVCVIEGGCKLKGVLARAEQIQREYLNSVRLSDVLPYSPPVPLSSGVGNAQANR